MILMKGTRQKGFTLIELMIVIAIIGILAAIAIPQFTTYRQRPNNSAVMSDLKNISTAQEAYHINNKTYASSIESLQGWSDISISDCVIISISKSDTAFTLVPIDAVVGDWLDDKRIATGSHRFRG
jgi:type IV pilus assembly protein PilA